MNVQSTSAAWLAAIEQREEIGTILHLGAGWGNELAACLETGAREVVLVEPNADFLSALEREAENNPRVRLLPVAVSAKPGRAPFHLLNFSSRSSLNVPTGLSEIFPGLREVAEVVVETLSIDQILERLALDVDASHVLIVDCPGAEHVVLDSLLSIDRMLQFRHVFLYGAKEIMYDGSRSIDELVALLEKHGYQVEGRDTTDPDFPGFRMRLDPLSLDNARLGAQLQQTLIETETLRAEVAARNDRIAQLEKALTEARDEATGIGGARADIEAMLEAANGRLAVRDIRVAELETALDQARSMAEFAGKACGEAETRLKAETDRLAERDIEIAELERALTVVREAAADVGKTRVEAEARLAEVSSRLAARDGLVTELEKALAEARTLVEASGQACSASEARLKEESSRLAAREAELEKALAEARAAAHAAGKARSETESRLKEESVKLAARDGRVAELEKQLGESRAAAEVAAKARGEIEARMKEETVKLAARDTRVAELEKALSESRTAAEAAVKARSETESRLKEDSAKLAARDDRIAELENALTVVRQETAAVGKALSDVKAQLGEQVKISSTETDRAKTLEATLSEAQGSLKTVEAKLAGAESRNTELDSKLKQALQDVHLARQDLAVAVRLNAVVQMDFRDLQERYRETLRTKASQEELLRNLTPRLQEAALYLSDVASNETGKTSPLTKKPPKEYGIASVSRDGKQVPTLASAPKSEQNKPERSSIRKARGRVLKPGSRD